MLNTDVPPGVVPLRASLPHRHQQQTLSAWGKVFGDDVVATAIDRLVHHAEILSLKGDSYRLRGKDVAAERSRSAAKD